MLGSGLDVPYPRENRGLAREIAGRGAVVSEFALGTPPLAEHFPVRNRIISGLSLGLVVVEAARRSGSLISARLALSQDREVMAVPGQRDLRARAGARTGSSGTGPSSSSPGRTWPRSCRRRGGRISLRRRARKRRIVQDSLSREERRLVSELPVDAALPIDELAEKTGLSVSGLLALLLGLELKGAVVQHPGKQFQRRM